MSRRMLRRPSLRLDFPPPVELEPDSPPLDIDPDSPPPRPASTEDTNDSGPLDLPEDSNSTHATEATENSRASFNEESNGVMTSLTSALTRMKKSSECDDGPPAKVRKMDEDDVEGETCPICLELWSNSGDHKLVSLKCGHLFGLQCVERWLKARSAKDRSCPTCKSKANLKDLRFIYARKLLATDRTEISALQQQLEQLNQEKNKAEIELHKSKVAHRSCLVKIQELQTSLSLRGQLNPPLKVVPYWKFALETNMQVCKNGGSRVLTYNCRSYELYASARSMNNLFAGFGIRRVSITDYNLGPFVLLHPKTIRDMSYSHERDLLLTVSLDKCAKITDKNMQKANVTIDTGMPIWSCAWDYLRPHELYVGGVGGVILQYDFRSPNNVLQRMSPPSSSDVSPVASLYSTDFGLLSCQLKSCWVWRSKNNHWVFGEVPVKGTFMSLCYDADMARTVVCTRPGPSGLERSSILVLKTERQREDRVHFDLVDEFSGSRSLTRMYRPAFVKAPGSSWVAAPSESDCMVHLHGLDGTRSVSLAAGEAELDICSVQVNGVTILSSLSESRLRVYKAVSSNS